jgi:hypothetical protein
MGDQPTLGLWFLEMGIAAAVTGLYFVIEGKERRKAGIFITIAGAISSLLVVKEVGNLMKAFTVAEIIGPAVIVCTWGMLAYDIWLRRRQLKAVSTLPSSAQRKLRIHSALWGIAGNQISVREEIDNKLREALAFHVSPSSLGGRDPAEGIDTKFLEVKYSYGDAAPVRVSRQQGQWMILPEDPIIPELCTQLSARSTAVDDRDKDMPEAPRLQVDFVKRGTIHSLAFKADKIAFVDKVRPLISRERYQSSHDFTLVPSTTPRIDPGSSIECRLFGLRQNGSPDIRSLLDVLRSGNEKTLDSLSRRPWRQILTQVRCHQESGR